MEEFLTYLETIVPLGQSLRTEIMQKAFLFPPLKKGLQLNTRQRRKYIFYIKEGIVRNHCMIDGQQVTTHLFGKKDFISSFMCLNPFLHEAHNETVEACTECELIAISRPYYQYLLDQHPELNKIHIQVIKSYFDFHNKYVLNRSELTGFKLLKDFSEEFPYLYRYAQPEHLESLLELSPGTIPRLS